MLALIPVVSKIISALLQAGQLKKEEADAAQAALAAAQVQRDKTFSDFIQNTSNILYTIMRNAIVGIFAAALVIPGWGKEVSANAAGMPVYFWVIILWEFYGNAALSIVPWMKSGNGNGNGKNGNGILPSPPSLPNPTQSLQPLPSGNLTQGPVYSGVDVSHG